MINLCRQEILQACALFRDLTQSELEAICAQPAFYSRSFTRDEVVAFEEDACHAVGIVASGSIHIQRLFTSGKTVTIETFTAGDSFGEALVFAGQAAYPATLIAREDTQVLYLPRQNVIDLCARSPQFMTNFLRGLSDKVLLLNQKIKSLTLGSVRQKVAHYLIEETNRQKSNRLALAVNRGELADHLGIPRPSLSRELILMKEAGWIAYHRSNIHILNAAALAKALDE